MRRIGKIENRNAVQKKIAVINTRVATHIYRDLSRSESPRRMRQFARRDCPVVDEVVIGAGLLDHFPGKSERSR